MFCSNAKHNSSGELYFNDNSPFVESIANEIEVPFIFVKSRPYKSNGLDRILNMVDFYRNVKKIAKGIAKMHGDPDVIFASSVHPLTLWAGIKIAKKYGVKCICEVRDLWPESLIDYGYLHKKSINTKLLRAFEKKIYKKASSIVFTMEGAYDYIVEQGWENVIPRGKVHLINNGVDIEQFDHNRDCFHIQDAELEDPDTFKVIYVGSIRKVNGLDLLLNVAKRIQDQKIVFLIWGNGDEKDRLIQIAADASIQNVFFKGRVNKKYIPYITTKADLNIAHNRESELFRFGVSFNKIFDYLAAGKPILCDFTSRYNPVIRLHAGIEVTDPTGEKVAEMIQNIAKGNSCDYEELSRNARNAAEQTYNYKILSNQLIALIEQI